MRTRVLDATQQRRRAGRVATTALVVLATACTSAPPSQDSIADVVSTESASIRDEPSTTTTLGITADYAPEADAVSASDITALQTGTIEIVEEWTHDGTRHRVTHDLAFDLETGVVREQFNATDLGEALLAPIAEWGRVRNAECSEAAIAAGEEPGESGCGSGQLASIPFAFMLTQTDSFSIGDPRADDPGVVMTVSGFVDVMNNAQAGLLSLNPPDNDVASWFLEYPPLEDLEASQTWGSLEPWADQVPFATYASDMPRTLEQITQLMTASNTTVNPNGTVTVSLKGQQTSKLFLTRLFDNESIDENVVPVIDDIEISIVVNPSVDESTLVPPPVIVTRDELLDIADGA